jgi:HAD superfamily hydrolase (TIGR01509 family)
MFSPNGIKTILFDLDGTLRLNRPSGWEVFIAHARTLGLTIRPEDRAQGVRWEHQYWAGSPELFADLDQHQDNTPAFWRNYSRRQLAAVGAAARTDELAPQISKYMEENYRPGSIAAPACEPALQQLKQAGFRLGVVSNRDNPFADELERIGLSSYFEFSLAGGEVQMFKPEPGIFEAALRRVDSTAHEAVYVGDNYYADVVGARRAGLYAVLYDPDGIYPEVDCAVMKSYDQLTAILQSLKPALQYPGT